jgi:glycosyltransferase involved in cell wall biosynthesis
VDAGGDIIGAVDGAPGSAAATPTPRIRVLVAIKCLGFGGAERLLVDMVARGDREAFAYEVAYVLASENALAPVIVDGGTPVHCLGAGRSWDVRWMARLRALLVRGRFDVVHFHLPYTASLGRLVVASMPAGRRPAIVYTEHSLWNKAAIITRVLNRATVGLDQSLVVVSQAAHDALPDTLKDRARIVVHGVDLSQAAALAARRDEIRRQVRAELDMPEGEVLALAVANLRPEKGYDVLLESARMAADRNLPVRFAAVGGGALEDELRERHDQLDLGDRFRFLGPRTDVLRLMTAADVFVLASHQEGLPVTLMEATSVGLAIVATSVGGVPQAVADGVSGLIVPPGDPGAFTDALERVATDPALRRRLGDEAQRRSSMFDVGAASGQVESIYRRLAGTGRQSLR